AVLAVAAGVTTGVTYLKVKVVPELNQTVSARDLWGRISPRAAEVCLDRVDRAWRYGLNYYSVTPLPECSERPSAWRVRQQPGRPPRLEAPSASDVAARVTVDPPSRHVVLSTLRN